MPRLEDRLDQLYRLRFVGREPELAAFRETICAEQLPFAVIYLYGPGGVGKTLLLKRFLACCKELGVTATYLDGRNVEVSPSGFNMAMETALNTTRRQEPFQEQRPSRQVVLVDTYEMLASLDCWLRDVFLPQVSEDTLIVLAGRAAPALEWRTDLGWQALCKLMPLRNLTPEESRRYLTNRSVPQPQHEAVLDFTFGHPLALALVADLFAQRADFDFSLEAAPDVVHTLLQQFVRKLPGPAHLTALESCALVRVMTEPLLEHMLGMPDVHELFEWLRELSFIEIGDAGLFMHDLAREVLVTDLRWRNKSRCVQLHNLARSYYLQDLQRGDGRHSNDVLFEYLYLHRHNSIVKPFFDWSGYDDAYTDMARAEDRAAMLAMVEQHEGKKSACLAAHWLTRQPQNASIFRKLSARGGEEATTAGWMMVIDLRQVSEQDLAVDPAVRTVHSYLQRVAPLEAGETALFFRFWMDRETYQSVSHTVNLIFINAVRYYLTTERLAYTFFPCADPVFWAPIFDYADMARVPELDYETAGRSFGMFAHDWRKTPADTWLMLMSKRELMATDVPAEANSANEAPLLVLSKPQFETAVKSVLRAFTRPEVLSKSPLLRSRLVEERIGTGQGELARIEALKELVQQVADYLFSAPRDARLYRALELTYFTPIASQERAADQLDVSFATFRRYLKTGGERLTEALWQREIGR